MPPLNRFIAVIFAALFTISASASTIFSFSFSDDPAEPLFNRAHVPGTVTGFLYGLMENGEGQLPTSIELTSSVAPLGMTDTVVDANDRLWFWDSTGFNIINGTIVSGGFGLNFVDPMGNNFQFRLNDGWPGDDQYNLLMWNGGAEPVAGTGNRGGFAGATYALVNSNQLPEPASLVLFAIGIAGLGMVRKNIRNGNSIKTKNLCSH